jgi:release factor glutamine methyltransferase
MTDIEYLKKYYKGNINDAIKLYNKGMPVQYIVGEVDFYGYVFKVNENVLIPRFETEQLVEYTINYAYKMFDEKIDVVDLGCGSGCIAITLKKKLDCNMSAVDISSKALEVALDNAKINDVSIDFYQGDMLNPLNKKYDIIISNPPYIAYNEKIMDVVKDNEPSLALYAENDGLYYYEEILKNCSNYLKDKFLIAFEIGQTQAEKIKEFALKYLDHIEVIIKKDLQGLDRFIFIRSKND